MNPRLLDLAALGSGFALVLAFAPYSLWPAAPLAVAVLFACFAVSTPKRAAWRGFLFGCGQFGFGCLWIHESFQFANVALGPALALTGLFALGMALYPAALGALLGWARPRLERLAFLVALCPAGWVAFEWLRGRLFTGFTWLQLGYSQTDGPLLALLPYGGVLLASVVLALVAGAFGAAALMRTRGAIVTAVVAIAAVACVPLLPEGDDLTDRGLEPFDIALVQGNFAQDEKWQPEMRAPTLERYRTLTRKAAGADLVVWPETALPGLQHEFGDFLAEAAREARDGGYTLLTGIPVMGVRSDGSRYLLNSVIDVAHPADRYDKRHLVPFGEYLPLREWLAPLAATTGLPTPNFSKGPERQPVISAASWRLGISVCYEIAFGREVRRALPASGLLVTVSNDAWFGTSKGPHQHFQMARARAAEAGRALVRATNTGITAVVGPTGEVVAELPQFESGVLRAEAWPRRGATPYVAYGDLGVGIAIAVGVIVALGRRTSARAA